MKSKYLVIMGIFLLLAAVFVAAIPEGPDKAITIMNSTRRTVRNHSGIDALAGNVTQLNISGASNTQNWAGYYGNVTGTITLENSDGFRMYTWDLTNPKGEVYATESTLVPQWGGPGVSTTIECWNYSKGLATYYVHYAEIEGWDGATPADTDEEWRFTTKGIRQDAPDSINNTFRRTSDRPFPSFYVGTKYINGTNNDAKCPSLGLYNQSNESTYIGGEPTASGGSVAGGNYQEVILWDNYSRSILFTSIIDFERDTKGFDGRVWDFQMIVPEKGTSSDTSTTTYNFYVELE
jgi:hypothetical protein